MDKLELLNLASDVIEVFEDLLDSRDIVIPAANPHWHGQQDRDPIDEETYSNLTDDIVKILKKAFSPAGCTPPNKKVEDFQARNSIAVIGGCIRRLITERDRWSGVDYSFHQTLGTAIEALEALYQEPLLPSDKQMDTLKALRTLGFSWLAKDATGCTYAFIGGKPVLSPNKQWFPAYLESLDSTCIRADSLEDLCIISEPEPLNIASLLSFLDE